MEKKKQAVIYVRVAASDPTENQFDLQTIEPTDFAKEKGYTVAATFIDDGRSSDAERPVFKAMIEWLMANRGTTVIMRDLTRLSRDIQTAFTMGARIVEAGGRIIFANPGNVKPELVEGSPEQERLFKAYRRIAAAIEERKSSSRRGPKQD